MSKRDRASMNSLAVAIIALTHELRQQRALETSNGNGQSNVVSMADYLAKRCQCDGDCPCRK